MTNAISMAERAGVVAVSLSLAAGLEWLCLRGMLRLMPARVRIALPQAPKGLLLRRSSSERHV